MCVFTMLRSPKAALIWSLALLLPLLLTLVSPLLAVYGVLLIFYLMPCALCMSSTLGGLLPMVIGLGGSLATMYLCFGLTGALIAGIYLAPVVATFILIFYFNLKFVRAIALMAATALVSQLIIFFLLQGMADGRMYESAGEAASAYVAGMEECDMLLITLYQGGLIGASGELTGSMFVEAIGGYTLTEAARKDFLLSLSNIVTNLLSSLAPNAIVSQSVYTGVGTVALSIRFGSIQWQKIAFKHDDRPAVAFPDLGMPPLAKWYLPRGWGLKVGVLAIGYLLYTFSRNQAISLAGTLMYAAFSSVYALQGIAFVNFIQHKRDSKFGWRIAAPILLFLLVNQALVILGVVDQISGARGLRPPILKNQGKDDDLL